MMDVKLDELYQEVILDHNKRPRNFGELADATAYSHGVNPLCGDDYHLYLSVGKGGCVDKIAFKGTGCAISKASASLMTAAVENKSVEEAQKLKDAFIELLTKDAVSAEARSAVGKLKFFEGVKHFPVRVKCATLAWHALGDALKDERQRQNTVTTE
jgi:nitrogen fixation protein NifU and related proteins